MKSKIQMAKIVSLILIAILPGLFFAGCTDDILINQNRPVDQTGVPEGFVRVGVNLIPRDFEIVRTRVLNPDQEHAWTHVHVAQFKSDGFIGTVERYPYDDGTGNNGNFDVILEEDSESTIYFILNYGDKDGDMNSSDHNPFLGISTLSDFLNHVYTPITPDNPGISAGDQLVMVGSVTREISSTSMPITSMLVYVDKLTAKLDVVIYANQVIAQSDHPFPGSSITITGLKIKNVPTFAAFADKRYKISAETDLSEINAQITDLGGDLVKTYRTTDSLYILENLMHDDATPVVPGNPLLSGEEYKNLAAEEHGIDKLASYLEIKGEMNDGRNVGKVTWNIYLGENNANNFNLKRNTHYTVTVNIDGAGIATSDIRADRSELAVRELRWLNGRYGSNRNETTYLNAEDPNWGNNINPAPVAYSGTTSPHLYMDAGSGTWGFEITSTNWSGFTVSYLPLKPEYGTDPGTNTSMSDEDIRARWEDDIPGNWRLVTNTTPITNGFRATGLPSGARVRINTGVNASPSERRLIFKYFNDILSEAQYQRTWTVIQYPGEMLNVVDRNFIPYKAGKYGVMVRAKPGTYWKLKTGGNNSSFKFEGSYNKEGQKTQTALDAGYVEGHGTIVFNATTNTNNAPFRNFTLVVSTFDGDPSVAGTQSFDKTIYVYQMASAQKFLDTKNNPSNRYAYDYSSDPLFETMVAFVTPIPMGINLLEDGKNYNEIENAYEAWSATNGKANTWKIYEKLEKYVADNTSAQVIGLNAPAVFSPAGLAIIMNEDFQQIDGPTHEKFEWYIPARYPGLMDATSIMLGMPNMATYYSRNFWTSTMPLTQPTEERHSGYFAGTGVDVSANFSATSSVHLVRDKVITDKTYPYVTQDYNGSPVIVTYDEIENKGYVNATNNDFYRLGFPLRFTDPGQISHVNGSGPSDPNYAFLSPRFRIAKQDAVIRGTTTLTGPWVAAAGWSNANANDVATPASGCAAYQEDGGGWRVPSELEMRIILMLGGGYGSYRKTGGTDNVDVPPVQIGGKSLNEFDSSKFQPLGETSRARYYWANRKYPNDNRAVYMIAGIWVNGVAGSSADPAGNYYVRCVRDIKQ